MMMMMMLSTLLSRVYPEPYESVCSAPADGADPPYNNNNKAPHTDDSGAGPFYSIANVHDANRTKQVQNNKIPTSNLTYCSTIVAFSMHTAIIGIFGIWLCSVQCKA